MNKLLAFFFAIVCLSAFATDYYWQGASTAPNGGDWHTASNWTYADGTEASNYPHSAGDVAIFNGATSNYVTIAESDVIVLDGIRFVDGCTVLNFQGANNSGSCVLGRMQIENSACVYMLTKGKYNHTSPTNVTVSNRDELLVDLCVPGVIILKDGVPADWWDTRSLTVLEESGKLYFNAGGYHNHNTLSIGSEVTWDKQYSMLMGHYGVDGHILFTGSGFAYTIPSGQMGMQQTNCHLGSPTNNHQGIVRSPTEAFRFWPSWHSPSKFRSLINAPRFITCGFSTTILFDDHYNEHQDYCIPSGTLQLGSTNETDDAQFCRLGSGNIRVSWSGKLDVQCDDALNSSSSIIMSSYRRLGQVFGKISMNANGTVSHLYIDGVSMPAGTYGSAESPAANKDARFDGAGVLTVTGADNFGARLEGVPYLDGTNCCQWRLFDGYIRNDDNDDADVNYDLGSPKKLSAIRLYPDPSASEQSRQQNYLSLVIQGSNDRESWSDVITNNGTDANSYGWVELEPSSEPPAYRYYRIRGAYHKGYFELEFWSRDSAVFAEYLQDATFSGRISNLPLFHTANIKLCVAGADYGSDYSAWQARGMVFDGPISLASGDEFTVRAKGLDAKMYYGRVFAVEGGTAIASQKTYIFPGAPIYPNLPLYINLVSEEKNQLGEFMNKLQWYDGNSYDRPSSGNFWTDTVAIFDLTGLDPQNERIVGLRIWPVSTYFKGGFSRYVPTKVSYTTSEIEFAETLYSTNFVNGRAVYGIAAAPDVLWREIASAKETERMSPFKELIFDEIPRSTKYLMITGFQYNDIKEIQPVFLPVPHHGLYISIR